MERSLRPRFDGRRCADATALGNKGSRGEQWFDGDEMMNRSPDEVPVIRYSLPPETPACSLMRTDLRRQMGEMASWVGSGMDAVVSWQERRKVVREYRCTVVPWAMASMLQKIPEQVEGASGSSGSSRSLIFVSAGSNGQR